MSTHLFAKRTGRAAWAFGLLFNQHAWWLGVHYSSPCRRFCVNLLPCLTIWLALPGGKAP